MIENTSVLMIVNKIGISKCCFSLFQVSDYPSRNHPDYLCRNHAGLKFPSGSAMYITYHPNEATKTTKFSLNVTHVGQ